MSEVRLIDANSLKKAIDTIKHTALTCRDNEPLFDYVELPDLIMEIDNAPTVAERPQGGWIPVSERLPDDKDYHDCYGFPDGVVIWQTDNGNIGFGWYYHSTKCWSDINDYPIKSGKVIAWQPLPKPYELQKGGAE